MLETVVVRLLEQCGISCKYRRWRSRVVALCLAVRHFSLAILPRRLLPRASAHVAPQRGRHVTLPGPLCARGQRRWHGQQNTVLCDDCSAAPRDGPLVSLCVPVVSGSLVGLGHPNTHRAYIGSRSRLGAIAVRHTGGRDAAWHGPLETDVVLVPKAHQMS